MANLEKLSREYGNVLWSGKKCIIGLPISFTRYILTDTKFITKIGFFNIKEDELELYRVYDKSLSLTFGERIVGCGTIQLMSKDTDTPSKIVKSIKHPRAVKNILDSAIQEQRDKYYVRGRDMVGANGATSDFRDADGNGIDDREEDR